MCLLRMIVRLCQSETASTNEASDSHFN